MINFFGVHKLVLPTLFPTLFTCVWECMWLQCPRDVPSVHSEPIIIRAALTRDLFYGPLAVEPASEERGSTQPRGKEGFTQARKGEGKRIAVLVNPPSNALGTGI